MKNILITGGAGYMGSHKTCNEKMKRAGKPEDLAETEKFLLSSNSSWITGQIIHRDEGKNNLEA